MILRVEHNLRLKELKYAWKAKGGAKSYIQNCELVVRQRNSVSLEKIGCKRRETLINDRSLVILFYGGVYVHQQDRYVECVEPHRLLRKSRTYFEKIVWVGQVIFNINKAWPWWTEANHFWIRSATIRFRKMKDASLDEDALRRGLGWMHLPQQLPWDPLHTSYVVIFTRFFSSSDDIQWWFQPSGSPSPHFDLLHSRWDDRSKRSDLLLRSHFWPRLLLLTRGSGSLHWSKCD